jgi:hypothetical protein
LNVIGSTYKLYRNVNKIAGKKYFKKKQKKKKKKKKTYFLEIQLKEGTYDLKNKNM